MTIHTLSATTFISGLDLEWGLEGRACLCFSPQTGCFFSQSQVEKKRLGLYKPPQMFSTKNALAICSQIQNGEVTLCASSMKK